ncbi:hypothetical protein BCV70DRAFT_38135 [Testicularia cyperi]|uniref:DUF7082 domain-containing protein n=1 Tax=Testicularia cyperi TaxID=1882483 RepID=A0A317XM16_9BASI|nr:hypothetical protein BCV70DRAFT_38135 [Testicularia cyperi]
MSGGASTNPAISFGPMPGSSMASASAFQSTDPSSSSAAYGSIGGFQGGYGRVKTDGAPYAYDGQAPRSQHSQGNYTHHDLSGNGGLAQTQALGGYNPPTSQHYADSSRLAPAQGHYMPGHTRHQSLNSGVSQLGLGGGSNSAYSFGGDVQSGPYYNYNLVTSQRSPSGRNVGLATEDSPTRSRFASAGYNDPRSNVATRPSIRPVGLGVSVTPGPSSDESIKTDGGSPRSLKRAADHMEDLRSSSEHALRRPASFPVLGTPSANAAMYQRNVAAQDLRSAQSVGRTAGRGGMMSGGRVTPGRSNIMLPAISGSFYEGEGRRESMSSSATMQSPVTHYGGSGSSEELGLSGSMPQLMRATQIPGSVTPTPGMGPSDPMYSPPDGGMSGGAPRAKLELHGNLNDMAVGWSHDEWRTGRRLVQFWRRQEGTTIHATFRPILPSQYVPNSIVISCIFREDKNECFVTSVDTIYLLEALVASRFTVEEKNRIRRNLEGFRPITVSKNKRECERFFKLIMSFPNPKPRNIEKDVKVFPWKVLASALCKIIGKYSASYDGGLPVLADLGPDPSFGGAAGMGGGGPMSGVDLSGGHYREMGFPGISPPGGKETRLTEPSFDYSDRQVAGQYDASSHGGVHHAQAGYGGNPGWGVGGQGMQFGGAAGPANAGYGPNAGQQPPPQQAPQQQQQQQQQQQHQQHQQQQQQLQYGSQAHASGNVAAGGYESFGPNTMGHGQQGGGGDASHLYGAPQSSQQPDSSSAAGMMDHRSGGQSQDHSSSTLAGAGVAYYSDRRS